jgi:hypothetical protein
MKRGAKLEKCDQAHLRLLIGIEAQASALALRILRMGPVPATANTATTEAGAMGRRHQQTACSLFERYVSVEDGTNSHTTEGNKMHWNSCIHAGIQL